MAGRCSVRGESPRGEWTITADDERASEILAIALREGARIEIGVAVNDPERPPRVRIVSDDDGPYSVRC